MAGQPVPLSEQAHWKNREQEVPAKPMSAGARAVILMLIMAIIGGGFYGFEKLKDYKNGSKEMTLVECNYYGKTSPDSADTITFEVSSRDTGSDGSGTTSVRILVPNVDVMLRDDGKNFTTLLCSIREDFIPDSSFDYKWERATILVPNEQDLKVWREFLEQVRLVYDLNCSDGDYKPRRIIPEGWGR